MNSVLPALTQDDILIVDDSLDNLRVLSSTLVERGYGVRCVKSGAMALIGIQTAPPDLILLDIRMPDMDGYETCQRIKANPQTREIPIIFLSALDEVLDKVKAFQLGGADYITKPFQVEEVLARVEHQLTIQRLQKQLMQKNRQLQQEIAEHQKTELALRDAKEAAEAANHIKSDFLARMSHELRTPLTAISGFTGLMHDDTSLPSEYQEYLATIRRTSQHLLKLINNILTIAQADNSRISLNERNFDLYHFLDTLEADWQSIAEQRQIQFISERAPELPHYIYADESKLRQILNNLLENAINLTTAGRVILRVLLLMGCGSANASEAEMAHSNGEETRQVTLQFEVEDTIVESAVYDLNHLFDPFLTIETEQKEPQKIGAGLSLSRQFVQRMGGDISVSSKPSQGMIVSFYIQIPLAADQVADLPQLYVLEPQQAACDSPEDHPAQAALSASLWAEEVSLETFRAIMSASWLTKLHHAAIKGVDRQILQLIQEIPPSHLSLANLLKHWTINFQFHQIVELTRSILEER